MVLALGTAVVELFAAFIACDTVINQLVTHFADTKRLVVVDGYPLTISIGVLILSACLALLYLVVAGLARAIRSKRLRRFFGLSLDYRVLFVIPSYRCLGTEASHIQNLGHDAFHDQGQDMFFKQRERDAVDLKKPFQDPICLSTDVASYFFAARLLGPKGLDFQFQIDEKVVHPTQITLTNRRENPPSCLICFGSGSSNYLARYIQRFEFFSSNPATYSFSGTDTLLRNGTERRKSPRKGLGNRLVSSPAVDYAVVARYTDEDTTFFLCAGIDQAGSIAATQILLGQWSQLLRETKGANFFYIYKIDRLHLRPEALYEEKVRAKPIYPYVEGSA